MHICTACERPVVIGRSGCHTCINFSRLHSGSPTLHSDSQASTGLHMLSQYWSSWNIMCSFKIYCKWSVQVSKQANKHTHTCLAVTLGLAPTKSTNYFMGAGHGFLIIGSQNFFYKMFTCGWSVDKFYCINYKITGNWVQYLSFWKVSRKTKVLMDTMLPWIPMLDIVK